MLVRQGFETIGNRRLAAAAVLAGALLAAVIASAMNFGRGKGIVRRGVARGLVASLCCAVAAFAAAPASAQSPTLTIAPNAPSDNDNCYVFGSGGFAAGEGIWNPSAGFVYKNLPPFELRRGDAIAFDTSAPNNVAVQLQIEAAPAANGTATPTGGYERIVTNAQTPATGVGNAIPRDFELAFQIEDDVYGFAGGGLILRFSASSPSFAADPSCTANLASAGALTDTSGFFFGRFYRDADGAPPYTAQDSSSVGGFRVTFNRTCAGKPVTIRGTEATQTIVGTAGPDVIAAYGAKDTVRGLGGSDVICGGDGKDKLFGGGGNDKLLGGKGKDKIMGGKGTDVIKGGKGKDVEKQ